MKALIAKMLTSADDQIVKTCLESTMLERSYDGVWGDVLVFNKTIILSSSIYHEGCTHIYISAGEKRNRIIDRPFEDFKRLARKEAP